MSVKHALSVPMDHSTACSKHCFCSATALLVVACGGIIFPASIECGGTSCLVLIAAVGG